MRQQHHTGHDDRGQNSRRIKPTDAKTALVERLVDSGTIVRVAHPTDRRIAYVRLTEAGHAAFAEMAREHAEWIGNLFSRLPAAEVRTLLRLLGDLKQSVRAAVAPDGDA